MRSPEKSGQHTHPKNRGSIPGKPAHQNTPSEAKIGGVLKCMLARSGHTKGNGNTVYLGCAGSNYCSLSPLPWTEYKAKRQIRQLQAKIPLQGLRQAVCRRPHRQLPGLPFRCRPVGLKDDRPLLRHTRHLRHHRLQPRQGSGSPEQHASDLSRTHTLSDAASG